MRYTPFGHTGLKVSVIGLGCGGFSRLGQRTGHSENDSVALVQHALDLGINFIDTARTYGTEPIVGKAIKGYNLDKIVISTKATIEQDGHPKTAREVIADLEESLRQLNIDCIDIFHLHGVLPQFFDHAVEHLVPALLEQRDKGKFRFLGITETPPRDPHHQTLQAALQTDYFSACMVALHMLHQSANAQVLKPAQERSMGTLIMFAVRVIFSHLKHLRSALAQEVKKGTLPAWLATKDQPLDFLIHPQGAHSLTDAAYRYCRHQPGADVVLVGTGDKDHLSANVKSILSPPLPAADLAQLETLFGHLQDVGLDAPGRPAPPTLEKKP